MKKVFLFSIGDYIEHWIIVVLAGFFLETIWYFIGKIDNTAILLIMIPVYTYLVIGYLNLLLEIVKDKKPTFVDMFLWGRSLKHFIVTLSLTTFSFLIIKTSIVYASVALKGDTNELLIMSTLGLVSGILVVILGFSLLEMIDQERRVIESIKFAFKISFDYLGEILFSIIISGVVLILLFILVGFLMLTGVGIIVAPFVSLFVGNWAYLYYVNLYIYIKQKEELKNNF